MSDPAVPPTPTSVEEARRAVMQGVVDALNELGVEARLDSLESTALDAYAAAVCSSVVSEVREIARNISTKMYWTVTRPHDPPPEIDEPPGHDLEDTPHE